MPISQFPRAAAALEAALPGERRGKRFLHGVVGSDRVAELLSAYR